MFTVTQWLKYVIYIVIKQPKTSRYDKHYPQGDKIKLTVKIGETNEYHDPVESIMYLI